ncbi:UbiA-like protein EboC [Parapedobacter tibetensis]|uniref:UbiA-like protein EboC n=1 Tax=Parapedobacter tibetensis TaxID=2972951 RepID=UPI00214D37FC|nr:UbiA-like protein EboC [Parapedobacter tibetensis]
MWKAYLQLMRPANVVTAVSDVLAGAAISTIYLEGEGLDLSVFSLAILSVSTIGLYGGGVVFNDVFDAKLDAKERPERPIPSGKVPLKHAMVFGSLLFAVGVLAAGFLTAISCAIAISITLMCLLYDKWAKHHFVAGPIVMGLCRGLNLMLGMSIFVAALPQVWMLSFIPIIYIAAITTISRGEVHGGKKIPLLFSALLYAIVIGFVTYFGVLKGGGWLGMAILIVFAAMIYTPLLKAIKTQAAGDIRKSVKYGVLALIFMNAVWVAAAGLTGLTVVVLSLFPISIWLSKMFSVT